MADQSQLPSDVFVDAEPSIEDLAASESSDLKEYIDENDDTQLSACRDQTRPDEITESNTDPDTVTAEEIAKYQSEMPIDLPVQKFYDGIILYKEEDTNEVKTLMNNIFESNSIKDSLGAKIVLCDEIGLGCHTEVHAFELGIKSCTVVFLYVTEKFCKSPWLKYCSDTWLSVSLKCSIVEKKYCVVPIFTKPKEFCPFIPDSICSIKGVQYCSDGSHNEKCINSVKQVLEDKLSIRKGKEMKLLEEKKKWVANQKVKVKQKKNATRKSESEPAPVNQMSSASSETSAGNTHLSLDVETVNPENDYQRTCPLCSFTYQGQPNHLSDRGSNDDEPVCFTRSRTGVSPAQEQITDLPTGALVTGATSGGDSDRKKQLKFQPEDRIDSEDKKEEVNVPHIFGNSNRMTTSQSPQQDVWSGKSKNMSPDLHRKTRLSTEKPVGTVAPVKTDGDEDQTERKTAFEESSSEDRNEAQRILMSDSTLDQFQHHPEDCNTSENVTDQAVVHNNGASASGHHGENISSTSSTDDATRSCHAGQNSNHFERVTTTDSGCEPGVEQVDTMYSYSPQTPCRHSNEQSISPGCSSVDPPCFGHELQSGDDINSQSQPCNTGDNANGDGTPKNYSQKCIIM